MPYSILKHLNLSQAIDYLKSQHAISLTKEDLLSFCEEEHCRAYVETYTECGWADGSKENHYGVGHQLLLNPKYLLSPGEDVVLYLRGDVRYDPCGEAALYHADEWMLRMKKKDIRLRISKTDLDALGALISGRKKSVAPGSSSKAQLLIIAGMMDLIMKHTTKKTQDRIAEELIAAFRVPGMSKRVINGIFAEAKKAKKALGSLPPA